MKTCHSTINTAIVYKVVRWIEDNQGNIASLSIVQSAGQHALIVTTPETGIRYIRPCASLSSAYLLYKAINGLDTAILQANGFEVVS